MLRRSWLKSWSSALRSTGTRLSAVSGNLSLRKGRSARRALRGGIRRSTRRHAVGSLVGAGIETFETRIVLSTISLQPTVDGLIADRNLDGQFETVDTTGTAIQNRWFSDPSIGEERGIFEFDLNEIAPGTTILSASLDLDVLTFTSSQNFPLVRLESYAGDGVVSTDDGTAASSVLGRQIITDLGEARFDLDTSTIETYLGDFIGIRMHNSELNGPWAQVASSETFFAAVPVLRLEIAEPTASISLEIQPDAVNEGDGATAATGLLTRTGDLSQSLTVSLTSSDTSELTVPTSVTIAAGEESASFDVAAIDDLDFDGTQTATVTATIEEGVPVGFDATFANDGIATVPLRMQIQPPHAQIAVQPDGKILAASEHGDSASWRITRLNPDGTLDTSFGDNGLVVHQMGASSTYPQPYDLVIQPDGKFLVGGVFAGGIGTEALARYNADGTVDTSFGTNGIANFIGSGDGWVEDLEVLPDGKILIGIGESGSVRLRAARLNPDGTLDSTFGSGGQMTYSINAYTDAITVLDNGQFLIASGVSDSVIVARMNATGFLDSSFGTNGVQTIPVDFSFPSVVDLEELNDGRILLGFTGASSSGSTQGDVGAMRLLADGSVDTTFGSGGIATADVTGLDDVALSMAVQPDGRLILAGFTETAENVRELLLVRFTENGVLDSSFDDDGIYVTSVIPSDTERIYDIALQQDGKLVALAGWGLDFRVARFETNSPITLSATDTVDVLDNENSPPLASNATFTVNENSPNGTLVGTVSATDPDPGTNLNYSISGGNTAGGFAIHPTTGQITVADSTVLDFESTNLFLLTVTVTDDGTPPLSDTATIVINVLDVNDAPVADDQTFTIDEDTSIIAQAATDEDGDELMFTVTTPPTNGLALFAPDGRFQYLPDFNFHGTDSFTFTVSDGELTDTATITVNVTPVNDPPFVDNPEITTDEDTAVSGQIDFLEVENDPVTFTLEVPPENGDVIVNSDGTYTYTPNPDFHGSDGFAFRATDDKDASTVGAVFIEVLPVNDAPVAEDDEYSVNEDETLVVSVAPVSRLVMISEEGEFIGQGQSYDYTPASASFAANKNSDNGVSVDVAPPGFSDPWSLVFVAPFDALLTEGEYLDAMRWPFQDPDRPGLDVSGDHRGHNSLVGEFTVFDATWNADQSEILSFAAAFRQQSDVDEPALYGTIQYNTTYGAHGGVLENDIDVDGDFLTALLVDGPSNGTLTLNPDGSLNYTPNPNFHGTDSFTYMANDGQLDSAPATVMITVNPVNDAPTVDDQTVSIAENSSAGTSVGTVAASDPDAGQALTYEIIGGNESGAFEINGANGQISVADSTPLDFEAMPNFTLTVQVTDDGSPALSDTATFTINLMDVNEAPSIADETFSVDENSPAGTVVGTVAATDPDAGASLTFEILNSEDVFAIDPDSGEITVVDSAALDFEATPTFELTVQVTDNGSPGLTDTATVTINLTDVNEAPIAIDQSFTVAENSVVGTPVGAVVAMDPDAGQSLTFQITGGNTDIAFAIHPDTGAISVENRDALDFEATPTFTLTVQVTDNGSPALSDTATITINLMDVNETPSIADQTFSVDENSPAGTEVGTVAATDPDANSELTFELVNSNGDFAIDPETGVLTVVNSGILDFEAPPAIELTVRVTDNGSPALTDTATIMIVLTDVNEAPSVDDQTFSVPENSLSGTMVGTVAATDPDAGASLTYEILDPVGPFAIASDTGMISVVDSDALDFETTPTFTLTVQVTDNGSPGLTDTATVTINLIDVNEAPSIADQAFSVPENSSAGTVVGTAMASDPDANTSLTFEILNSEDVFAIDPDSGEITVIDSGALDFETTPTFELTVQVTDNGSPELSDMATITVNLTDVSEDLLITDQTFSLSENSSAGTIVGTVTVNDPDGSSSLTFEIVDSDDVFAIAPATGVLTVVDSAALDFETTPTFELTVRVSDDGMPSRSETATITVNLMDVNEAPSIADQTFSVDENSLAGTVVGTVLASDPDANTSLTFEILNSEDVFAIDPDTGVISVVDSAALDFEATPTFDLTVQVTDNGSPGLTDTAIITINLTDVNEAPVAIDQSFTVAENSVVGTPVGAVVAMDPDAGQSLTFQITGGNTDIAFAIHPDTGAISVENSDALDFETTPTYTLTVQVTDNGSPALSDTATVTINLIDVNEAPSIADQTFSADENSPAGTVVGTVAATDPDAAASLVFEILNSEDVFAIDPDSGEITVVDSGALDFESTPTFDLTVQVTDNGSPGLTDTATITINLTDVNEAPVAIDQSFTVAENSVVGTPVGAVVAMDPDAGQSLTFQITGGNTDIAFAIHPDTGAISVENSDALDFEATPTFTLTVQVTDNGSPALSDTATITINLMDVNEAPSIADQTFSVDENSLAGTEVGTVLASDPDANTSLTFEILNSEDVFAIDPDSGVILVVDSAALDFESTPTFDLTVQVTDNGSPGLSDTATITINLTDVNEAPSIADQTFSVDENSPAGTVVGTVAASDPDAGASLTFEILNSEDVFAIDPDSGEITVVDSGALDFESTPTFDLTVQVTDNGSPGLSDMATITVNLTDVNEAPSLGDATFSVPENSPADTVVGTVAGSDPDSGQSLTYELVGGNTDGAFAIDPDTGAISVDNGGALDFETTPTFTLTVQVTDTGSAALSDTATITIDLTDVNEAPSVADQAFSVDENSPAGTVVGTVAATDPDAGQALSYEFIGGNESGAFDIDGVTGQITVADAALLDFESMPTFTLTVQVTDNGSPVLSDTATITIEVREVGQTDDPLIDIRPGDDANVINIKSRGNVWVAVLSTADFDAPAEVDPESLTFGRTGDEDSVFRRGRHNKPKVRTEDVDGDGLPDLVVKFQIELTGFQPGDTEGVLKGRTWDGTEFEARDSVEIVSPGNDKDGIWNRSKLHHNKHDHDRHEDDRHDHKGRKDHDKGRRASDRDEHRKHRRWSFSDESSERGKTTFGRGLSKSIVDRLDLGMLDELFSRLPMLPWNDR